MKYPAPKTIERMHLLVLLVTVTRFTEVMILTLTFSALTVVFEMIVIH